MTERIAMTKPVRSIFLAALALGALTPVAASAANIEIAVKNPVIELTVNEVVQSAPDTANVGAGVTVRAPTASEALRLNAAQMDKVIARLRQLGIAREDIQTANFSLNAQYQYRNDNQPPLLLGYDVSNSVNVTLRRLEKVGETFDALVSAGANNLYGPNFTLEKDAEAKAAARKAAFARAQAQANEYAQMAGYRGTRILEISETFQQMGPLPVSAQAIEVTAASADAKTQIEPGRVGTGVTLTVKYEMTS
jgi:uncharacterized protein YggE